MISKRNIRRFLFLSIMTGFAEAGIAQERPAQAIKQPTSTALWNGFYGKVRLSDKLFWDAQFHYRRAGSESNPFVDRMGQIYNRHALSYLVNERFSVSLGPVLRLNYSPDPGNPDFKIVALEPRIWHEYLFAMPMSRSMIYHRVRIEHRWSQSNRIGSEWIFRNRWRYKFYMNIPLNNTKLSPGTIFFTPDVEIIMQSGKRVVDSPLEDLRINPSLGYILNPRTKLSIGMMYTTGQTLDAGYLYTNRWILRTNAYFSLDFRKREDRVSKTRLYD